MAKVTKRFKFTTPFFTAPALLTGKKSTIVGNLEISAIGYFHPHEPHDGMFTYDIESVALDGKEIPLPVLQYLFAEDMSGIVTRINTSTIAHLEWLFMPDEQDIDISLDATLKEAHKQVTNGNFSGDNLFNAMAHVARAHADHLLNGHGII